MLLEQFWGRAPRAVALGRTAGHEQGAASIAVGIAAVLSIATNRPVNIAEVVDLDPSARKLSELI